MKSALFLGACGLLPSPAPETPFPSDGVAAFGDSSPIALCIGPAAVVSPSASVGAGAVCVAAGGAGAPCAGDAACSGIERCVCGRCIVQACQGGSLCPTGQVCADNRCTTACTKDADCGAGGTCDAGGCTRACTSDAVCNYGERCDPLFNVCTATLCSELLSCASGETCEAVGVAGDLHEPEVVTVGGTVVAYVELRSPGAPSAIYRARIDAPGQWTADPATPVLGGSGQGAGAPSVLVGAEVEMYFAIGDGKGIGHAVSTDGGRTFTADAAPVLVPAAGWENGWVGSPAAVPYQGATLLFYEGGPRAGVGFARIQGGAAVRVGDGPIASPKTAGDPVFWRDLTEVGAPYAVVAGDVLRVYFTGRGIWGSDALVGDTAVPADACDSIGLTASLDGKSFVPYLTGPVYARITNLRAYLGEREAAVMLLPGGGAQITFVSSDASGANEAGLAEAGNGGGSEPPGTGGAAPQTSGP